jgi:hypothetical protein
MLHYHRERGFDSDEVTCTIDLLADLLHYLHSLGEDPFAGIEKAREYFETEASGTGLQILAEWFVSVQNPAFDLKKRSR